METMLGRNLHLITKHLGFVGTIRHIPTLSKEYYDLFKFDKFIRRVFIPLFVEDIGWYSRFLESCQYHILRDASHHYYLQGFSTLKDGCKWAAKCMDWEEYYELNELHPSWHPKIQKSWQKKGYGTF